jgi:amino acid adenylation domain-containing protein/FkbH-like protein
LCEFLQQKWNKKMLILSTFNSDSLQFPIKALLKKFTSESITIKYSNKNLMVDLLSLNSNLEKSYAILLRLSDLTEADSKVNETKLKEHLDLIVKQITALKHEKGSPFIVFLCPSPDETNSQLENIEKFFIEKLNENKIHTLTLADVQEKHGIIKFENPIGEDTHTPYSPKFYKAISHLLARKLHAIIQKPCKVIVVDCDNTLWSGAAVDDGSEDIIFQEHNIFLQKYLVKQQENGVIICLCSRNVNEKPVLDVFKKRQTEMPLKLDHITTYKINEELKSGNIKKLAVDLNLFPDSFRFIDDNPTEIYDVSQIPGVFCITMPQSVEEYKNHWAFDIDEHAKVTETDKKRTELYKQAEIKAKLATRFHDPVEFLRSPELSQIITINKINSIDSEYDKKAIARVNELSGRTNQFNLFPESKAKEINEINLIVKSEESEIFIGSIKDKFSATEAKAEDITAIAISSLDRNSLIINSFFVSCRVFRRGMEYEMLKHIAQFSQERGLENIKLKFKKSEKNKPVSSFLNILSEQTNKDPISRNLLNKSENYTWINTSLKFLFKNLNICLDFNSLELNEEFILTLSTRRVIDLDLDALIRASLNVSLGSEKEWQNKKFTSSSNEISENYLIDLKQITASLLVNDFSIDNKEIHSLPELENKVIQICNHYLGKDSQDKSLVARGLDSLKATELRYYLYESEGINISIPKLLCKKTTALSLFEFIEEKKISSGIVAQNDNFYNLNLPSSFQQQRIWFAEQKEQANNSANYHMTACYKVSKNLDIQRFETACQELIKLYDVFGTTFFLQNNELKQLILSPGVRELNFQVRNLKTEMSLEEAIQREIKIPWTMSNAPLIRFIVFKGQVEKNYYIFFHVHHAIFDAVSLKNCLDTLSKVYQNILTSNLSKLIAYPPQYIEFIHDQQKKLEDEAYQTAALNFWQNELSKIETVTTLPNDQSISIFKPATELTAKRFSFTLSSRDLSALKVLAQSTGVTCFSAVSALFSLLIGSYTYQEHITLVTATNGRGGHPSFDKMVGFFVNLLVQQFDLEKNERFTEYLKKVNKKILASQEFQDTPFNKIQEILYAQGIKDILLSPAFIYQSYTIPELRLDNETAELEVPKQPIIFDRRETCRFGHFTLFAQENEQGLIFILEYAEDLFSPSFIDGFAKNFLHTIRNVSNNPNQKLQDISVICDEEQSELISLGQGPQLNYAEDDNLVKRFQCSVEKYPNNIALFYGEMRLSYKEVDQQSTNLVHALIKAGVQQGDSVGIFLEANHLFFIAELAALKIGAIFIPLSKEDPYDRLKSIIEDAKIKFFIVDNITKGLFDTDFQACQLIAIHSIKSQCLADNLPLPTTTMEDNACILYTSGSTGKPKGVILPQKAIFRVIETLRYMVKPENNIAQTANQVFDAAQLEFFLAFLNGASLVIFDKNVLLNKKLFTKELLDKNISVMWLTAGLFNLYALKSPEIFMKLKFLMSGGDIVDKKAVEQVLCTNPNLQFMNGYGPTETGIFTLTYTPNRENLKEFSTVPIGKPTIAGTQIFILNVFNGLAPLGAIGQLGISGEGLGDYHNNEVLQKKCFLPYPKNLIIKPLDVEKFAARIYMSGDKVQFRNNQISFLGRMNEEQIKIRGNLVALAEIKEALGKHSALEQFEILYKKINDKNKSLIVFYTEKKALKVKKEELIQFLSTKLSPAMVPIFYEKISKFPFTANGKIDRVALSKLPLTTYEESDSDKENTPENLKKIQEKLLAVFKDILPNSLTFTLDDNFFYMGGNSIEAVQLIAKIEAEFGKIISFNILRQNSSIRSLSLILERDECLKSDSLSLLHKGTDEKLHPIIFIHPAGGGLFCFNKLIDALQHAKLPNYCYGIEDPVILERKLKKLTIPDMATSYLEYIRGKIKGPFILAGYSFGGMVALEIAVQLEELNQNCLGVILLDTWVVSCANKNLKEALRSHVLEYCEEVIKNVSANPNVEKVQNLIQPMMEQCKYYQQIGFEFRPKKLVSTSVSLFKAKDTEKFKDMERETQFNYLEKFIKSKNLVKYIVEGNHFNLLEEGINLAFLATEFVKYIEKISQSIPNVNTRPTTFFSTIEQDRKAKSTVVSKQVFGLRN